MRPYRLNSAQAAARIVALAMLADGHVCKSELEVLDRLGAGCPLGLQSGELRAVVQGLCEDMLSASEPAWGGSGQLDPATLAEVMAEVMSEVTDPDLRTQVLNLCVAVVEADAFLAEGESTVLLAALQHWGLHEQMLQPA
jgi:uncharacterized tellurite resistance protein B-like protein